MANAIVAQSRWSRWGHTIAGLAAMVGLAVTTVTTAQQSPAPPQAQVRYFEQGGIRYQETRMVVPQAVRDVRYIDQQQTSYLQRTVTENKPITTTRMAPQVQYECVPRLHDWWRIFGQPYIAYHMEPKTVWVPQQQTIMQPVTRREVMPQTQTVKIAVPFLRFEEREKITTVALGPASTLQGSSQPSLTPINSTPTPTGSAMGAPRTYVPVPAGHVAAAVRRPPTFDPFNQHPHGWTVADQIDPHEQMARRQIAGSPEYPPGTSTHAVADDNPTESHYGGVARLDGELPRYGTGVKKKPEPQITR